MKGYLFTSSVQGAESDDHLRKAGSERRAWVSGADKVNCIQSYTLNLKTALALDLVNLFTEERWIRHALLGQHQCIALFLIFNLTRDSNRRIHMRSEGTLNAKLSQYTNDDELSLHNTSVLSFSLKDY